MEAQRGKIIIPHKSPTQWVVEPRFELGSVLLEGLLCGTMYALLSTLRKAHLSAGLHRTDKLTVQQRKLIIDSVSINSFREAASSRWKSG